MQKKRYQGLEAMLDELEECIPSGFDTEKNYENQLITEAINQWLESLPKEERVLFEKRYYYGASVKDLAMEFGYRENQMAQKMMKLRKKIASFSNQRGGRPMTREDLYKSISEIRPDFLEEAASYKVMKRHSWKRWGVIAACLCICFCSAVPVLAAADNKYAYEVLYAISPAIAQKLKPVNVSCEDNGIRMKVMAVDVEGANVKNTGVHAGSCGRTSSGRCGFIR